MAPLDYNKLFRDAQIYSQKLSKFEVDWIKIDILVKLPGGGYKLEQNMYPKIKIEYK